jgi:hypothetical protein
MTQLLIWQSEVILQMELESLIRSFWINQKKAFPEWTWTNQVSYFKEDPQEKDKKLQETPVGHEEANCLVSGDGSLTSQLQRTEFWQQPWALRWHEIFP